MCLIRFHVAQLLQRVIPIHGRAENLALKAHTPLMAIDMFHQVVLFPLATLTIHGEQHHTSPIWSSNCFLHPCDVVRVQPGFQVTVKIVVDEWHGRDFVFLHSP